MSRLVRLENLRKVCNEFKSAVLRSASIKAVYKAGARIMNRVNEFRDKM